MKIYKAAQFLWQRISYWGDKGLTLLFYLLFGLIILSYKFIRWLGKTSLNNSKRSIRMLYSAYKDWRMGRRIKSDYKNYGLRRSIEDD